MNVASLELCTELYKLSGWGCYYENTADPDYDLDWYGANKTYECPKYPLGYLLRKLPLVTLQHVALDSDDLNRWNCITEQFGVLRNHYAETPEDAACKLAIELVKKGVL